ncbi:MAG: hypothetical protein DWQ01_13195 [Planctomycetota bacterium]|nr:MAG: hypothetical protein DWQ01_13195 [Planctomycetota bacterium]
MALIPSEQALSLLNDLERRVLADPEAAAEWHLAWQEFGSGTADPSTWERFRQWFFIERPASRWGAPPLTFFAPQSIDRESPWHLLMDTFLGIFQRGETVQEGPLTLQDLWTGRTILVDGWGSADWIGENTLVIGRFLESSMGRFQAMAGVFALQAEGLPTAVQADIQRIHKENPRSRLSQLECERLFATHPAASIPESAQVHQFQNRSLELALAQVLAEVPEWDLTRLVQNLEEEGLSDTLARLAFETDADLETLRRLLPEFQNQLQQFSTARPRIQSEEAAPEKSPTTETHSPAASVEEALQRFDDGRSQGRSLDALFRDLEADLGLEEGSSYTPELALEGNGSEKMGPDQLPGFGVFLQTYQWEREQKNLPLEGRERRSLQALGSFLDATHPQGINVLNLTAAQVVAFFMTAPDPESLTERRHGLASFLEWLQQEQDAPLGDFAEALLGDLGHRILALVQINHALADQPRQQSAVVVQEQPLAVAAAEGESALVEGFPQDLASQAQAILRGDHLYGRWNQGRFQIGAVIPKEALPAAPAG